MRTFKLIVKQIKDESMWGTTDKDAVKRGKVAFAFKGKTDDYDFDFKKGEEVYFQYGNRVVLDGEEYLLVSLTNLVCQK